MYLACLIFFVCWDCLYDMQEKFLLEKLEVYESAVGDSNVRSGARIEAFPPPFQTIPRNPIVLDLAYDHIEFPSLLNRMKKETKGFISRFWR